jgi:23S rRNA pseudouridine1911/1915/1917 synthase
MFHPEDLIYEDNHIMVVAKRCGDLVQPDPSGSSALENEIKTFLKVRDHKEGNVFLGVVHRIDRNIRGLVHPNPNKP